MLYNIFNRILRVAKLVVLDRNDKGLGRRMEIRGGWRLRMNLDGRGGWLERGSDANESVIDAFGHISCLRPKLDIDARNLYGNYI